MVQPPPASPPGPGSPRRRRRTATAALGILLAVAAAVGVGWRVAGSSWSGAGGREVSAGDGPPPPAYAVACRAASPGSDLTAALPGLTLACLGAGPALPLGSLAGQPTIVNLWASWCLPCQRETPRLQQAFTDNRGRVRFVGVDTRDRPGPARAFLHDYRVGYEQLSDPDGVLLARLGAPGLPVTLALNRSGRVVYRHVGEMREADVGDAVRLAVA